MPEYLYIAAARDLVCMGPEWGNGLNVGQTMLGWRVVTVCSSYSDMDEQIEADLMIELLEDQLSQENPDWMDIEQRVRIYIIKGETMRERNNSIVTTIDCDPWIEPGDQKDFYRE